MKLGLKQLRLICVIINMSETPFALEGNNFVTAVWVVHVTIFAVLCQ
jgi:hypothetical protein